MIENQAGRRFRPVAAQPQDRVRDQHRASPSLLTVNEHTGRWVIVEGGRRKQGGARPEGWRLAMSGVPHRGLDHPIRPEHRTFGREVLRDQRLGPCAAVDDVGDAHAGEQGERFGGGKVSDGDALSSEPAQRSRGRAWPVQTGAVPMNPRSPASPRIPVVTGQTSIAPTCFVGGPQFVSDPALTLRSRAALDTPGGRVGRCPIYPPDRGRPRAPTTRSSVEGAGKLPVA